MEVKDDDVEISKMLDFIPELQRIFDVKEKVGEGTFSKVYRSLVKTGGNPNKEYALKYLIPTSRPSRVASELQCLKEVGGSANIVGIELCLMHQGHVVIVMPYFAHQRFGDYMKLLTVAEIRDYMKNLLIALDKIHAHGIIHRDVKPNNFLYDRLGKRYALVDFGLAQRTQDFQRGHMSLFSVVSQPFKDHNTFSKQHRSNRSEPTQLSGYLPKEKSSVQQKRPYKSAPQLQPQKRALDFSQENYGNPTKKRNLDFDQNDSLQMSSKTSILPTPPHTPSSRCSQKLPPKKAIRNVSEPKKSKKESIYQKQCSCFGENAVCKLCLGRIPEEAPRGGTPGFRAPEVLLKYREQTTAVDMWSAGVIFLSLLSRKYPFFRAEDDLSSLAEIVFLVGVDAMKEAAAAIGKSVVLNLPGFSEVSKMRQQLSPSRYLQALCLMFHCEESSANLESLSNSCGRQQPPLEISDIAYDLLNRLLDPNPLTRITAAGALAHPFITGAVFADRAAT